MELNDPPPDPLQLVDPVKLLVVQFIPALAGAGAVMAPKKQVAASWATTVALRKLVIGQNLLGFGGGDPLGACEINVFQLSVFGITFLSVYFCFGCLCGVSSSRLCPNPNRLHLRISRRKSPLGLLQPLQARSR